MTHDERIEAMARAMHRDECERRDYPRQAESFDNLRDGVKDILLCDARAAWAAAGVEEMVREAAVKGINHGARERYVDTAVLATIVREVMGK